MEAMREFLKGADYVIDTSSSYGLCPRAAPSATTSPTSSATSAWTALRPSTTRFSPTASSASTSASRTTPTSAAPSATTGSSRSSQPSLTVHDVAAIIHPDAFPGYHDALDAHLVKGEVAEVVSKGECTDPYAVCPGETAPTKSVYAAAAEIANECIGDMCALSKDTGGILDESISVYKTWLDGQSPTPSPPPPPPSASPSPPSPPPPPPPSASPSPPPPPSPPPQVLEVEVERQVEVPSTTLSSEVLAAIIAPIAASPSRSCASS